MKIFLVFLLSVTYALADIVSAKWLNENLANVRVVEVSTPENDLHIPNAIQTTIEAWRYDNGTFLEVRKVDEIEKEISRLGITKDSKVVLYAPINEPKDLLKATYIYWALNYHGIMNVSLLDGGLDAYKKDYKLVDKLTNVAATNFKSTIDKARVANIDYVKANLGKLPMIDARAADMYLGITPTPTVKRNGHISGAMSYPWNYSINSAYMLKDKAMLEDVFKNGYKLDKNKEVLVYCTGGLETSFNYFVLSGVLGYKKVRLYDASMKEWGNKDDTKMSQYIFENFVK